MASPMSWLRSQRTAPAPIPAPRASEPAPIPAPRAPEPVTYPPALTARYRLDCGCFGRYSTCRCPGSTKGR
jgi:hypothetical protein